MATCTPARRMQARIAGVRTVVERRRVVRLAPWRAKPVVPRIDGPVMFDGMRQKLAFPADSCLDPLLLDLSVRAVLQQQFPASSTTPPLIGASSAETIHTD
jgi:hypothetical protein